MLLPGVLQIALMFEFHIYCCHIAWNLHRYIDVYLQVIICCNLQIILLNISLLVLFLFLLEKHFHYYLYG